MPLPANFAAIWRKYDQMLAGLDADDPDDRREMRSINRDKQRELIAIGVFDAQGRPLFPQAEMDRALGGRGPIAPYGLTRPAPTPAEAAQSAAPGGPPLKTIWQGPDPNLPGRAAPNFPGLVDPSGKSLYDPKTAPPRQTVPAPKGFGTGSPSGGGGVPAASARGSAAAPGGQTPPAPGASYAGMSDDGKTVRWYMPDGTIQFTDAQGSTAGQAELPPWAQPKTIQQTPQQPGGLPVPGSPAATGPTAPSKPAPPSGVTAGEYEDFLAFSKAALSRIGVGGRDVTNDEVRLFVASKFDAAKVEDFYRNDPDIVAANPGAPFGLSKYEYDQRIGELEGAERSVFGQTLGESRDLPRSRSARESSRLGQALRERTSGEQYAGGLERFRQERGRVPTQSELSERRMRPTDPTAGGRGAPEQTPVPRRDEQSRPAVR
jgi:hypothetical protein